MLLLLRFCAFFQNRKSRDFFTFFGVFRTFSRPMGWVIEKRLKLGWWNFHHTVAPSQRQTYKECAETQRKGARWVCSELHLTVQGEVWRRHRKTIKATYSVGLRTRSSELGGWVAVVFEQESVSVVTCSCQVVKSLPFSSQLQTIFTLSRMTRWDFTFNAHCSSQHVRIGNKVGDIIRRPIWHFTCTTE